MDAFDTVSTVAGDHVLGVLGAVAIVWGSLQAMRVERLKLLVAYSTVAQFGYLFLWFPLAREAGGGRLATSGVVLFALAHACAKAAVFLAMGAVMQVAGHDRISGLRGIGNRLPLATFAFGLAAVSLMGLPPSGGFAAKWLMLQAAITTGQWYWGIVIVLGGLLAAGYLFRFLSRALEADRGADLPPATGDRTRVWKSPRCCSPWLLACWGFSVFPSATFVTTECPMEAWVTRYEFRFAHATLCSFDVADCGGDHLLSARGEPPCADGLEFGCGGCEAAAGRLHVVGSVPRARL